MSQNISLKWNSHNSAVLGFFSSLHEKQCFSDATIVCNGKLYPVHQIVLSVCSDYFNAIFRSFACDGSRPQHHPVLILWDISISILEALLVYMYQGEVTLGQQNIAELMIAAKSLKVKGLSVSGLESSTDIPHENAIEESTIITHKNSTKKFKQANAASIYMNCASSTAGEFSGSNQNIHPAQTRSRINRSTISNSEVSCGEQCVHGRDTRHEHVNKFNNSPDDCYLAKTSATTGPPSYDFAEQHPMDATEPPPIDTTEPPPMDATEPPPMDTTEPPPMDATEPPPIDTIEPPPMDNTVPTNAINAHAFTVKLEPGVGTVETETTPKLRVRSEQDMYFSPPPLDSADTMPRSVMDTLDSPPSHSMESDNKNSHRSAESEECVGDNSATSVNDSLTYNLNCIPELQLQIGTKDYFTYFKSCQQSSSSSNSTSPTSIPAKSDGISPASMPVITHSYSILQSEIAEKHNASDITISVVPQTQETHSGQNFLPMNLSTNELIESNKGKLFHSSKAIDTNVNVFPMSYKENDKDGDKEFQNLTWTVPTSASYQSGDINQYKSAPNNSTIGRRKVYRCKYCSYRTCWKKFLLRHQLLRCPHRQGMVHNQQTGLLKNFDCPHCEHSASSRCNLKNHLQMHNSNKKLHCYLCSYSTNKDYWLQTHITKDHGSIPKSSIKLVLPSDSLKESKEESNDDIQMNCTPAKEDYQCELCQVSFQRRNCFLEHKRIHCEPKNVKCPDCDYHTLFPFNLKKHTSIPSRGLFKCDYCSYTTCTGRLMTKHVKLDGLNVSP